MMPMVGYDRGDLKIATCSITPFSINNFYLQLYHRHNYNCVPYDLYAALAGLTFNLELGRRALSIFRWPAFKIT